MYVSISNILYIIFSSQILMNVKTIKHVIILVLTQLVLMSVSVTMDAVLILTGKHVMVCLNH